MDELAEAVAELARWALSAPKQLHGIVLIHCTSTTAGYLESLKDKASMLS